MLLENEAGLKPRTISISFSKPKRIQTPGRPAVMRGYWRLHSVPWSTQAALGTLVPARDSAHEVAQSLWMLAGVWTPVLKSPALSILVIYRLHNLVEVGLRVSPSLLMGLGRVGGAAASLPTVREFLCANAV